MKKYLNRTLSFVLSVSVLLSSVIFGGAITISAANSDNTPWSRTIEFDQYVIDGNNTYYPNGDTPYFSKVDDEDGSADKYLHYYNYSGAGAWTANWNITPTHDGKTNTNSDQESGQVLPTSSDFKLTFRIRMNDDDGGKPTIAMFYGTTTGRHSIDYNKTRTTYTSISEVIAESSEWQTVEAYFTTPDEYQTLTNGVANRLYVGILCADRKINYDLDWIKIEKVISSNQHPADGKYDSWGRSVEFNKYEIKQWENAYFPSGDKYGEYSGVPYFSIVSDEDGSADKYLHYYNHSGASDWAANWSITPTPTGISNANSDQESGQVLPNSTTFRLTFRIRMNEDDGGAHSIAMFYGVKNGHGSIDNNKTKTKTVELVTGITESKDWQTIEAYFTTPDEYETLTDGVANRLFVGVLCAGFKADYDLDWIKIEKVTETNLYVKEGSEYLLMDTLLGTPGSELVLPEYVSEEKYSAYDPIGIYTKTTYGGWYANEECTTAPIMKYGNTTVDLYCNNVVSVPEISTDNQEMFVGFDTYTQRTEGLVGAEITNLEASSGTCSLLANLTANKNACFELKNDFTLDLVEGKTYRVDFAYKSTAPVTFALGTANGTVTNGVTVLASKQLEAANGWSKASLVFTADGIKANSVLAAKLTASSEATVYIDEMFVSSATELVGVETTTDTDLRFMFTYGGNSLKMAGNSFAVAEHGVLIKGAELSADLILENKNVNGIFHFAQTDLSKNWSVNPVTGAVVYSAYVKDFVSKDDYKVSARGYIKLSDGTVYYTDEITASVADIPAAGEFIPEDADLFDYYVYLPAGTAFPAEKDYTVTTYNGLFAENNAIENNILAENSYVKFSTMPDVKGINVPAESKYLVHSGTKAELYYGVEHKIVTTKLDEVGKNAVNYLFITDIHYANSDTTDRAKAIQNQLKLMVQMANEDSDIDFIVVGGDITTGMYSKKEYAVKWTKNALAALLNSEKPVFVLPGNHDDNAYHLLDSTNTSKKLYSERVITDLDWQNNIIDQFVNRNGVKVVQDKTEYRENSRYYYYDIAGKNTRVIALDAVDYNAKYDENGNVLTDLDGDGFLDGMPVRNKDGANDNAKYYSGSSYWGYSADQVRWLAEDALGTLPDGYEVVFVSHMGPDKTTNSYGSTVWFADEIRDVIKAFNAGEDYTANLTDIWGEVVVVKTDFSEIKGDIVSWQFGHQHIELSYYDAELDLWEICTATADVNNATEQTPEEFANSDVNNKALPWRIYTRKLGDKTEACFNLMSVSGERIYRFTIGQGANEKLIYPD